MHTYKWKLNLQPLHLQSGAVPLYEQFIYITHINNVNI